MSSGSFGVNFSYIVATGGSTSIGISGTCRLTIRSSRTCFVPPKPWQKELAMALAPLRKSA